ncbi:MAG: S9 family peptidase [Deltaproteobacteria bacterium]|nr:MAG: S9 family peptidase [Deltaproteobacteria bacterium]
MSSVQVTPYGSWRSPITSELIVSETIKLGQIVLDGSEVYWSESRPAEGGRNVIVRWSHDGKMEDLTAKPFDARTRVHEYGGGAFVVSGGTIYFSNFSDQRLYEQKSNLEPRSLSSPGARRYGNFTVDKSRNRLICVREDHGSGASEPVNTIVAFNLSKNQEEQVLVTGNDFYSSPRISPDGSFLAWLTWNHPNLPWDGTELWLGTFRSDGAIGETLKVAGDLNESIFQPEWSSDGVLYFVSDRDEWWNFYRYRDDQLEIVYKRDCDFGRPQWLLDMSTYGFESRNRIICTYTSKGIWHLAKLNCASGDLEDIETPFTEIWNLRVSSKHAVFCAGSPTQSASVIRFDLESRKFHPLRSSSDIKVDKDYISIPQPIEFPTENEKTSHAFFYPPQNCNYQAPSDELPPMLVKIHGGPTSATSASLAWDIQYWTSRGFAVLDVNYGGSSGYGRSYRQRLEGQWGIVDVDDCVNGARFLVEQGWVDRERLAIRGSSAGGYTTLCALTFRHIFKAGASYYGISDLEALAKETHKFEARYLDRLVGPYPASLDIYRQRSPIHHTHLLSCPLILFQGLEDEVVPPNQAEMMLEALKSKGLPVAYIPFEGEQHGFRRAETIQRALDSELYFYSRVFNFELPDPVVPIEIHNL